MRNNTCSSLQLYIVSALLLIITGCAPQQQANTWSFEAGTSPLSFTLTQSAGGTGPVLSGDESALFYITGEDTQYVADLAETVTSGDDRHEARYTTTDGRMAEVTMQRMPEGDLELNFSVTPDTGILRKGIIIRAGEGEAYYGLMERVVDGPQSLSWQPGIEENLDVRGQALTMFVKPTVSIYEPYYVSSDGYGVFVEGTWPGEYDMASTNPEQVSFSFEGPELSVRFIPGPEPVNAVENLHDVIGQSILPPKWAFSVYHWRDEHTNRDSLYDDTINTSPYNSMLTEDILMLEALDIPVGVYWVDRPWARGPVGYDDFVWDPERFPMARQMIDWVKSKDKRFMLWIAPWVMGDMLEEAEESGFLIAGSRVENENFAYQLLDFTNPDAVEWWGSYLSRVIDSGIDAYKLDRAEELMPDSLGILLSNGNTSREEHNNYPVLYLRGTYEQLLNQKGNEDFLLMPRAAYTGSQRFGTFWGGDIATGPYGLRTAMIAVQRSAYMGFPVWGSDTGGYWGNFENYTHENLSRWLAFSCFTPIMEVGPLWNRAVWDMPKEPSYDPGLIATYRLYATIHTDLIDYSYELAVTAHEEGTPIVRPMSMAFPGDEAAAREWDQYMYGPDILVSIIWENGVREHSVYLPEGSWVDAWSGEVHTGSRHITVSTPRHKIPVFVREGSEVNLGDLNAIYDESVEIARERPDLQMLLQNEEF